MPERPVRMENNNHQRTRKDSEKTTTSRRMSNSFTKKKEKFGRKRSKSFTGGNGKFCTPYTCRRKPMLPTKFLLGGNICDPLNLNSLQDEEVNRTANAVTPKSSPIPTPPQRRGQIDVLIPPNINDPLNLIDCDDDVEYEQQLMSPYKKGGKRRKKKKRTTSATTEVSDADISSASEAQTPDKSADSAKIPDIDTSNSDEFSPPGKVAKVTKDLKLELSPQKEKKRKSFEAKESVKKMRRLDSMDKIVSPVVPQPGAWVKRPTQFNRGAGTSSRGQRKNSTRDLQLPKFKPKNQAYQYGNYNRYYGYRNPNHEVDPRLKCFAHYPQIFEGKDILDVGCNIGHITLSVARDFGAKSVVGLDIDKKLIGIARKNIRHYVNCSDSPRNDQEVQDKENDGKGDKLFPISMPILYGPVDIPGMADERKGKGFPHNVTFVQGNYVLSDEVLAIADQTQFDVILCLSVTKWMHLNWGDTGLKQAFKRMYAQLRPGGKLILEPQSWASYKQKKTLTPTIYKNYHGIKFFPEKFTQYLLSSEVGFAKSEIMGHPNHFSKGFQRPIQIFTKSDLSPSQSQRSYSATPSHTITSNNQTKPVYTSLASPSYPYGTESENRDENRGREFKETCGKKREHCNDSDEKQRCDDPGDDEWEQKINREIERRFEEELNSDVRVLNDSEMKSKIDRIEKDLVDDLTEIKNKLNTLETENELDDQRVCKRKHEDDHDEIGCKLVRTDPDADEALNDSSTKRSNTEGSDNSIGNGISIDLQNKNIFDNT